MEFIIALVVIWAILHPLRFLSVITRLFIGLIVFAVAVSLFINGCQLPEVPSPPDQHHRPNHHDRKDRP